MSFVVCLCLSCPIYVIYKKIISKINPLTYQVDTLRALMVIGGSSNFGILYDFGMNLVGLTALIAVCAKLYPGLAA
jgi:ABC-2 type transport system permease protein